MVEDSERRLHIISHSSKPEYYKSEPGNIDSMYIPWREVPTAAAMTQKSLMSKSEEIVLLILPQNDRFDEYRSLMELELLGGRKIDVSYTPNIHYLMDDEINVKEIAERVSGVDGEVVIYPYQPTREFRSWVAPLQAQFPGRIKVYADTGEEGDRSNWTNRGGHHEWIVDLHLPKDKKPRCIIKESRLSFPNGYIAQNKNEAIQARSLLGREDVVLKSISSAGGDTIKTCLTIGDIETYEWPINKLTGMSIPVAVQERLNIKKDRYGERVFSVHYKGKEIYGRLTRQRMNGLSWGGNDIPAGVSSEFEEACYEEVRKFLEAVTPEATGGIDLAEVYDSPRPVLFDVNARPTGIHATKEIQEVYLPNSPILISQKISNTESAYSAHEVLDEFNKVNRGVRQERLALDLGTQFGVFPLVWLYQTYAMLLSSAETHEQAEKQLQDARMRIGA